MASATTDQIDRYQVPSHQEGEHVCMTFDSAKAATILTWLEF